MRINENAIDNGKGQPIYKQTAYDLDVQPVTLQTTQGAVDVLVDPAVKELLLQPHRTYSPTSGGMYLNVSTTKEEKKQWNIYGKDGKGLKLHQFVVGSATGLLPDTPIDHINKRDDNRFNSLRLVTKGINNANGSGISKGGNPSVRLTTDRRYYRVETRIDGTPHHFFTHKDKATANQAAQVVLHYRSVLHAERSNMLMGRHLARCFAADVETQMAVNWTNTWHRLTTAAMSLEHYYLCGEFDKFPATPAVPVKELKALCCAVADGMDVTDAIAKAKAMAVKNERMVLLALIDAAAVAA